MSNQPMRPFLEAGLARIREIVGEAHVVADPAEVDRRARDIIAEVRRPTAYVYPGDREEVRLIVEAAAEHGLSLWPCSRGRNWGYGGSTPAVDGSIVVNMERMNRVLEVNEELAYARIEPGVSYRQLNEHLKTIGAKLWADCTDGPPEGSVMGNALERGIGETPYGDHFGQLCGMEVILADGRVVRTGGGAPDCKTWNTHRWGCGPVLDGLFSQSNLGIVTEVGIWLMPEPECCRSYIFEIADGVEVGQVVDAVRKLALTNAIQTNIHLINDVVSLSVATQFPRELLGGEPRLTEEMMAGQRKKFGIARWTFGGALYGSREQVRANQRVLRRALRSLGRLTFVSDLQVWAVRLLLRMLETQPEDGLVCRTLDQAIRLTTGKSLPLVRSVPHFHGIQKGIPSEYFLRHAYFKCADRRPESDVNPARDGCGLMWVAPILPMTGHHLDEIIELTAPLFERYGFEHYMALILQNPRSMINLMSIFFDPEDATERARALELYHELVTATSNAGYQQYRTSVLCMDRIFERAGDFQRLAEALKGALDPDNVLAPGRYGIGGGERKEATLDEPPRAATTVA